MKKYTIVTKICAYNIQSYKMAHIWKSCGTGRARNPLTNRCKKIQRVKGVKVTKPFRGLLARLRRLGPGRPMLPRGRKPIGSRALRVKRASCRAKGMVFSRGVCRARIAAGHRKRRADAGVKRGPRKAVAPLRLRRGRKPRYLSSIGRVVDSTNSTAVMA